MAALLIYWVIVTKSTKNERYLPRTWDQPFNRIIAIKNTYL